MKLFRFFFLAALFAATPLFAAEPFKIDSAHSLADFKVRHMMSHVTGKFGEMEGIIQINRKNPEKSSVDFSIKTASINTANERRDKHLRSSDFFDVEQYPMMTFKSTKIVPAGPDRFNVTGNLTMRGVAREVTLPVAVLGFAKDPWGKERVGFELETTLNRKDFGLNWNKALDQGGYLLADEVKVFVAIEAVKE